MVWKKDHIKIGVCALLVWLLGAIGPTTHAQDSTRRHKWLPEYLKLQYAGGIGFMSVGVGYQNRKEKLEGDFYYGYVPESVGGVSIHAVSAKITWHPVKPVGWRSWQLHPLSFGALVSYTFGKQYFLFSPKNYPYSYYNFPTALHGGAFVGGRLDKVFGSGRKLGLYYELGSNDREIVSFAQNGSSISVTEVLNLALGLRASF
jgi:hypothetical protein